GKLLEHKNVKGPEGEHVVALIQTEGGDRLVADLGAKDALKDKKLRKGQDIEVIGHAGRVDDRPVLFGQQAKIGKEEIALERPSGEQQIVAQIEQRQQQQAQTAGKEEGQPSELGKTGKVKGKVLQLKEVEAKNEGTKNRVVLLKTEDDRGYIVD